MEFKKLKGYYSLSKQNDIIDFNELNGDLTPLSFCLLYNKQKNLQIKPEQFIYLIENSDLSIKDVKNNNIVNYLISYFSNSNLTSDYLFNFLINNNNKNLLKNTKNLYYNLFQINKATNFNQNEILTLIDLKLSDGGFTFAIEYVKINNLDIGDEKLINLIKEDDKLFSFNVLYLLKTIDWNKTYNNNFSNIIYNLFYEIKNLNEFTFGDYGIIDSILHHNDKIKFSSHQIFDLVKNIDCLVKDNWEYNIFIFILKQNHKLNLSFEQLNYFFDKSDKDHSINLLNKYIKNENCLKFLENRKIYYEKNVLNNEISTSKINFGKNKL